MKKFFVIWSGQAVSLFGSSIVQFALVWYLTKTTGSATTLATATIVAILPALALMPFIGAWVDRWNRKWIMAIADLSIAVATTGLVLLFLTSTIQIWHIYLLSFVRSIGGAFHAPAMMATTPLMVPEKHLVRVNSLNQVLMGVMNVITPALGALFLELLPMQGVLAIDIVTAIIAVGCLAFVAIPQPQKVIQKIKPTLFADIKEGFKFIWGWPGLVPIIAGATIINFFVTPMESLSPLLITKHFRGGVVELGWMQSLFGVGLITGGLILSVWSGFRKKIITSTSGLFILALGVITAGFTPAALFIMFMAAIFVQGIALTIANTPIIAMVQVLVPKNMQGRFFALFNTIAGAIAPLGLVIAGPVLDALSVQAWYLLTGFAILAIGIMFLFNPAVRNIESKEISVKSDIGSPASSFETQTEK